MRLFGRELFASKETAAQRAEWLQTTLRSVAGEVHGRMLHDLRQTAQRNFETAETTPWTESWSTTEVHINDALMRQLPILWTRAAGLARNNEWAQSYLIALDDNVLGPNGIQLQMQLKMPQRKAGEKPVKDAETNALVESGWAHFCEGPVDVSGLTWAEVETLALLTLAKRGELLYRLLPGSGPMGFQIQMLDPTLLDVTLNRTWEGRRVRMGKEIDDAGKPLAYWLQAARAGDLPSQYVSVGKHIRVPANEIRHFYLVEEVGQLRGIPWLTVGARRLWLLRDFEESAAVASSNAAKRQGFFYTPSGEAPTGFADTIVSSVLEAAKAAGKVLSPDEIRTIQAEAEKFNTTVPGQFDTLPQGTQFQAFESAWPNVDAGAYVKEQIRGWSAARGVSYVTVGNNLEAVNYSSARVGILNEREHFKKTQNRLLGWLHRQVFEAALPYIVLHTHGLKAGRIDEYRSAATWQPRRWAGIDPVKEALAAEINLKLKLTSRRRLILERGEDPDDIAAEVAEEDALYGPIDQTNVPADQPEQQDQPQGKSHLRLAAARGMESGQ